MPVESEEYYVRRASHGWPSGLFLVLRYTLLPSPPFELPDNRTIPRFLSCSNVLFSIFKVPILIRTLNHRSSLGQRSSRRRTSIILLGLQGTPRDDLNDVVYREVHNFVLDSLSIIKVFVKSNTRNVNQDFQWIESIGCP